MRKPLVWMTMRGRKGELVRASKCVITILICACWINVAFSVEVARESDSATIEIVDQNYYEKAVSFYALDYATRKSLLNSCNLLAPSNNLFRLTRSVISAKDLMEGKVLGINLGMKMAEVIAVIGKPMFISYSKNDNTYNLSYGQSFELIFKKDLLSAIWINKYYRPTDANHRGLTFSNGLTVESRMTDYVKAFGTPSRERPFMCQAYLLQYERELKVIKFTFELGNTEGDQQRAQLLEMSVELYSANEKKYDDAIDSFIDTIADTLALNKKKIQALRWTDDIRDILETLEKALAKPLNKDQKEKVASALEKKLIASSNAETNDEKK